MFIINCMRYQMLGHPCKSSHAVSFKGTKILYFLWYVFVGSRDICRHKGNLFLERIQFKHLKPKNILTEVTFMAMALIDLVPFCLFSTTVEIDWIEIWPNHLEFVLLWKQLKLFNFDLIEIFNSILIQRWTDDSQ